MKAGVAVLVLAAACTGGPAPPPGGDDDVGDDDAADASVPPDGEPPLGPCDPPAFTGGVSTLAGCGEAASQDGARDLARFANPVNVIEGPDDRVYVADFDGGAIRVVDMEGNVETLTRQDGFSRPFGMTFHGDVLYVSTDRNDRGELSPTTGTIWRIDIDTGEAEVVVSDIGRPRGLVALGDGRIVLSDYQHHTLRILTPSTGALAPLAGTADATGMVDASGAAARFEMPYGLALLADGAIAVSDRLNDRIRRVELDGDVTTIASTGLDGPQGLTVAADGTLYVTDTETVSIRAVAPDGTVTLIAGDGVDGYLDHEDPTQARFYGLEGLGISADGTRLWVADGNRGEPDPYNRVRVVDL
jgi:sugar lactone lactonase YvrE